MNILLVANFLPDGQHSMQRFATMLRAGLRTRGHEVRVVRPRPVFTRKIGRAIRTARRGHAGSGAGSAARKWFGYVDKFILFPRVLKQAARWAGVVHICDHSNAMYVTSVRNKPHVVTCHDLLAVRGALGEETDCPASLTGKLLQRWILRSLQRARMIACVSSATRRDLIRLCGQEIETRSCLAMLGVAPTMTRMAEQKVDARLADLPALHAGRPFLLNVGSSLRRKNRDGALRIFKKISTELDCDLIFAGEPLSEELKRVKRETGLNGRVIEVPRPSDAMLEALYNRAFALLYPTKYEGFGWPAIEAQTCGCPVIASNSTSIPEVVGDSALLRAPDDEQGFATDILRLTNPSLRDELVARGFENVKRFTAERMVNDYLQIYQKLCAPITN